MAKLSRSEYSISSLADSTGWFELSGIVDDFSFSLVPSATWNGTVSIDVSGQADEIKTRYRTLTTTYAAGIGPLCLPRSIGRFVRFRVSVYVAGAMYVQIGPAMSATNQVQFVGVEGVTSAAPTGDAE